MNACIYVCLLNVHSSSEEKTSCLNEMSRALRKGDRGYSDHVALKYLQKHLHPKTSKTDRTHTTLHRFTRISLP
jgi:hypothetical protein